jgi:hypothetical protein
MEYDRSKFIELYHIGMDKEDALRNKMNNKKWRTP